jgi:hypothetical protein
MGLITSHFVNTRQKYWGMSRIEPKSEKIAYNYYGSKNNENSCWIRV